MVTFVCIAIAIVFVDRLRRPRSMGARVPDE
jgi:hypothetical protein